MVISTLTLKNIGLVVKKKKSLFFIKTTQLFVRYEQQQVGLSK